mgnify:CR=1 FL=1
MGRIKNLVHERYTIMYEAHLIADSECCTNVSIAGCQIAGPYLISKNQRRVMGFYVKMVFKSGALPNLIFTGGLCLHESPF